MPRDIITIMEEIIKILKTEKEVSIRGLMIKVCANRSTIKRGLNFLKKLEYVKERENTENKVKARLFSLVKK
jgi:predicted transcriptional regulator